MNFYSLDTYPTIVHRQKDDEEKIKHEGVHQVQSSGGKKEWESLTSVPLHKSQLFKVNPLTPGGLEMQKY
jgi:hypothetical protein